jgi:hypothetical protein
MVDRMEETNPKPVVAACKETNKFMWWILSSFFDTVDNFVDFVMSRRKPTLEDQLFNLKIACKQFERAAKKAEKGEKAEKIKIKKVCVCFSVSIVKSNNNHVF